MDSDYSRNLRVLNCLNNHSDCNDLSDAHPDSRDHSSISVTYSIFSVIRTKFLALQNLFIDINYFQIACAILISFERWPVRNPLRPKFFFSHLSSTDRLTSSLLTSLVHVFFSSVPRLSYISVVAA